MGKMSKAKLVLFIWIGSIIILLLTVFSASFGAFLVGVNSLFTPNKEYEDFMGGFSTDPIVYIWQYCQYLHYKILILWLAMFH